MLDRDEQSFFLWTEGFTLGIRHDDSGGLKNCSLYHRNFLNISIHMRTSIAICKGEAKAEPRLLNLANFNQHLFIHESCQCRVRPTHQSLLDQCSKVA